jgi:hypothetical protein|tara:strand:+ start:15726 stop:15896 length:171 start_codon:yes stop_codon:yes gene_type:complete
MVIIKKKICMENNTFEDNSRTKDNADEALSQSEKLLDDISNIFSEEDFKVPPFFIK